MTLDPDPLTVEPDEPEPRRLGCSVFVLALALLLTGAQPAAVSYSGTIGYAEPGLGRFYLAIPDGRGVRVEICGPAACLIRTSTDAGPDLAMQRAGRIADLNSVDWEVISGMPLRYGLTQGTVLILKRPAQIALPQTDTEEPR